MRCHFIYFYFTLVCISFFSCTKNDGSPTPIYTRPISGSKTYTDDEITGFDQLAFNLLSGSGNSNIIKLPKHVYYYIIDTSDSYFVKQVDNTFEEINLLTDTNLVIKRTIDSSIAITKIYFTDTIRFFMAVPEAVSFYHSSNYELSGMTYVNWGNDNIIYKASVFIDKDSSQKDSSALFYLLHHEIMHSLGMLGHTNIFHFGSVMYYFDLLPYVTDYSYFDKRMIQLLYNPEILPGMSKAEVDAVLLNL